MSKHNIHKAMGSLAYAIAKADGEIQQQEKSLIKKLAQKELEIGDNDIEWIEQMFLTLEKQNIQLDDAYRFAIDTLEENRYEFDFDASIRNHCIQFIQKIAEAFDNTSLKERDLINRFIKDTATFLTA